MYQKILKSGNSLAVTVPSKFVKILGLKPGDEVKVRGDLVKGSLHFTFSASGQMTLLSSGKK